jgi:uncharacterized protein YodC (DUF2158 family)
MSEGEKETFSISVGTKVYTAPLRHMLHYQEAIQQQCIALMAADDGTLGQEPDAPTFSIGDVVRLKSGGPEMAVSRVVTYPNNPDKCALIGCVWFTRVNDDCPAATRYPYDGTRYTGYTGEADFPADCLEHTR